MFDRKRREFITLLGGAAAWPLDAFAQQGGKVWRMGFIAHGHESFYDALFEGLREYGYEEGRNLIVERRYARGQAEHFKEFAAEMVRTQCRHNHRGYDACRPCRHERDQDHSHRTPKRY